MRIEFFWGLILIFSLFGCKEKTKPTGSGTPQPIHQVLNIPNTTVPISQLCYDNMTSTWMQGDQVYSGYALSYYQDGSQKEHFGVLNGKKQHEAIHWYPDGQIKQVANYHQGKLHGEKKTWASGVNHTLTAHLQYYLGKGHGPQYIWYPTGEIYKKINLDKGKEAGIQQAFRKNGDLYANYEARNGRIFGLKKAKLCFGITDESIQYEE